MTTCRAGSHGTFTRSTWRQMEDLAGALCLRARPRAGARVQLGVRAVPAESTDSEGALGNIAIAEANGDEEAAISKR